jgi:signal transduction histidine kinase
MLGDFRAALHGSGDGAEDARPLDCAIDGARQLYTHVLASLRAGEDLPGARPCRPGPGVMDRVQVTDVAHLTRSLRASSLFFRMVLAMAADYIAPGSAALRLLVRVAAALERGMAARAEATAASWAGRVLKQAQDAREDERRWIALELHDRIANAISAAYRQLELLGAYQGIDPVKAREKLEAAQDAVRESMGSLRGLTSDPYAVEPVMSLEKSLLSHLARTAAAEDVKLVVCMAGSESWAAPVVLREAFLVLREATSNALRHASAVVLDVNVEFTPTELRAVVEDDGCGFDIGSQDSSGLGISAMRERARLIGGTLALYSRVGRGTTVRLTVPLASRADQ